ncbi:MAG TPA: class I SAM-dependent methyltransferase [Cellulomonadaceae bacterium]|nr:class I SAM-dependent methyltransferase [Cellulomonadaceae bacterium]
MDPSMHTNAAIWTSEEYVRTRAAQAEQRERENAERWRILGELLPFEEREVFTFLDLGAGTGSAARSILDRYPRSTAILSDFSPQMIAVGEEEMASYAGRYRYVEFDMSTSSWPAAIPDVLAAIVSSMSVHHLPDDRKEGLFAEIFARLAPGGWYLNYDTVSATDPIVAATWGRTADRRDPEAAAKRLHRTPEERARHENHLRHVIPLSQQLEYLAAAGFAGIDVYWKHLDDVIYGGQRPSPPPAALAP